MTLDQLRADALAIIGRTLSDHRPGAAKRLAEFVLRLTAEATNHEGRDGYALVDAAQFEYLLARSAAIG